MNMYMQEKKKLFLSTVTACNTTSEKLIKHAQNLKRLKHSKYTQQKTNLQTDVPVDRHRNEHAGGKKKLF